MSRDFFLGDIVAYPTSRNGQPRREAEGRVDGFQMPPGWVKNGVRGPSVPTPAGRVRVIGVDGQARLFGPRQLRLVRRFDEAAA